MNFRVFFVSFPSNPSDKYRHHYSWNIHGIQDVIFCITNTNLLQMYCRPDSGADTARSVVTERQMEIRPNSGPDTPRSPLKDHRPDSGPDTRFTVLLEHACPSHMELRPTSGPDTPIGAHLEHQTPYITRTACLERERANQYKMMVYWDGPRYPGFCSYTARQRSFQNKD